jgi:DNA-binding MarR family transcriptional regulator
MVVKRRSSDGSIVDASQLDLGYLCLFLGLRWNELVVERLVSAGFSDVRQSHGYIVQHLIEGDRTITELAHRMEVTQQAASKVVAQMLKSGILELTDDEDRRAKRIRLSERGWQSVELARKERGKIESRLVKAIGLAKYRTAKKTLLELIEDLGGRQRIESRRIREPR